MSKAKVKLRLNPDGSISLKNIEHAGEGCGKIVDALAPFLGQADESTRQNTSSFYETTEATTDQDVQAG